MQKVTEPVHRLRFQVSYLLVFTYGQKPYLNKGSLTLVLQPGELVTLIGK